MGIWRKGKKRPLKIKKKGVEEDQTDECNVQRVLLVFCVMFWKGYQKT